jgi:isopropylmalate/homocitrate/citramalate synthase
MNVGFHGHNSFSCATRSSIEFYNSGAKILDSSIKGFGRETGNI